MNHIDLVRDEMPVARACSALNIPRSTYYGRSAEKPAAAQKARRRPARSLSDDEKEKAIATLTSEEFIDKAPATIVAGLLDRGEYICSVRTFYRLLAGFVCVMERRSISRHVQYCKPELLATGPRQLFSWDITKLKGPRRGEVYNLYVMLDVYSRYAVGWLLDYREQDYIARDFIEEVCQREDIQADQLVIHADNGPAMRSSLVAELLDTLRVRKSHSRPHCSDDNPYSEAQFKTLKYFPQFPERFKDIEDARSYCQQFFTLYNNNMYHSGIEMLTPAMVHDGLASQIIEKRQQVLTKAYASHPERFVKGLPVHKQVPEAVYINRPIETQNVH